MKRKEGRCARKQRGGPEARQPFVLGVVLPSDCEGAAALCDYRAGVVIPLHGAVSLRGEGEESENDG